MEPKEKLTFREWIHQGEWLSLMITILGCFIFVHNENNSIASKLDKHITDIHRRSDEINKRIDESNARSEDRWYELLKQVHEKK